MQTATCLKSRSRNMMLGISLDIQAMMTEIPVSMAMLVTVLVSIPGRERAKVELDIKNAPSRSF